MNRTTERQAGRARAGSEFTAGLGAVGVGWWLLAFAALGTQACSSVSSPLGVGHTQQSIEDGDVDEQSLSVFRIITRSNGFNSLCSSTLIAPNLLLTARHCVAETSDSLVDCARDEFGRTASNDELLFSNETEPNLQSRWYAPARILVQEEQTAFCGQDIALVVLEDNVPASEAVPSPPRLAPALRVGEEYAAVGYGASDDDNGTAEYGVRRSRSGLSIECLGSNCGVDVVTGEFAGLEGACRGDSGGPALDTSGRVMGSLSRGLAGCESPVYTSVAAFSAWVLEVARSAAEDGQYPLPEWAGGEPAEEVTAASAADDEVAPTSDSADTEEDLADGASQEAEDDRLAAEGGCSLAAPSRVPAGRELSTLLWGMGLASVGLCRARRRRVRHTD